MFVRSIKEISRLISKGMSNIYLNSSYWEKLTNCDFWSLKYLSPGQFLASSISHRYYWTLIFLLQLKSQWSLSKCLCYFCIQFSKELLCFKVREFMLFFNKTVNFNKNETKLKVENPTCSFRGETCASAHMRMTN